MDDEMKINAKAVRRMRTDRAWSQEQLAEITDVSLRTIQRVEADGSASRETKMALAAAFKIDVRDLSEPDAAPRETEMPAPSPAATVPRRYGVAGLISFLAFIAAGSAMWFRSEHIPLSVINLACMVAIATALYSGFGWYFSGRTALATPARRTAQFGFIFGAVALLFSSFSASPRATASLYLQMTLFACAIRFVVDWHFSRRRRVEP